ncbi:Alcohol dehydrogenase-like 6 [Glycine soja]|uniref:Alcohol dehydrogenase-like 6 n=1 Tax=Glycine soja TaxID=3848 RepID=A0A0B2PMA3_GLYSO|nr:Alcohol dehydrogenase-like 6 [Glycine soja]
MIGKETQDSVKRLIIGFDDARGIVTGIGLGAAWNVADVSTGSTVVIFGLGTVGLSGWGLTVTLGVPKVKLEMSARYGLLLMGRTLKGSLFWGWKPKSDLPSLVKKYLNKLQWVNSEEREEKVGSIVCSNVYDFSVDGCNLYDDFFSTGFMQLDHVKTLSLRDNNFTFLPECIKELQFLTRLDVSGCLHLREIKGVSPNLKDFTARECISLSSSSSSMLSNQELHEAGQTMFCFPRGSIPEWFNHRSRGPSSSFWFRNEFPDNVICLLLARVEFQDEIVCHMPKVFINGKLHYDFDYVIAKKVKLDYTYLFDLKSAFELDDLSEVALEKEWNHVEITYAGLIETSLFKATGIHVFRQDDIRYDDPNGKGKLKHELNSFESQPLIKKPRQISMDSVCRRCNFLEETCLHALRDCPEVAAFWRSPSKTIDIVFKRYKEYMRAHASHNLMTRNLLKWKPENSKDWLLRLNVSGAYDPSSGTAACGGIFSDNLGRFVLGFSVKLVECWSIDEAEIWGIYHGMKTARMYDIWDLYRDILRHDSIPISPKIARQHDFGKILVQSGSEIAIEFVLDGCPTSTCTSTSVLHCFPLCQELKALTSATNQLYFFWVTDGATAAADSFAEFGLSMKQQAASIFSACPSFCQPFIKEYR